MPHVLIIHEVEAYPAWKAVFDGAADLRKRAGEISYQLLRYDQDVNRVVHFSAKVKVTEDKPAKAVSSTKMGGGEADPGGRPTRLGTEFGPATGHPRANNGHFYTYESSPPARLSPARPAPRLR